MHSDFFTPWQHYPSFPPTSKIFLASFRTENRVIPKILLKKSFKFRFRTPVCPEKCMCALGVLSCVIFLKLKWMRLTEVCPVPSNMYNTNQYKGTVNLLCFPGTCLNMSCVSRLLSDMQ